MKIEREILHKLLYESEDFGISEKDYETEYYKEFEKKHNTYRETFSSLLPPELREIYNSVCAMDDYANANEFNLGKVVGFTIAIALMKTLDKPFETHSHLTDSFIPIKEAYRIDDESFNKTINEYKDKRGISKCNS